MLDSPAFRSRSCSCRRPGFGGLDFFHFLWALLRLHVQQECLTRRSLLLGPRCDNSTLQPHLIRQPSGALWQAAQHDQGDTEAQEERGYPTHKSLPLHRPACDPMSPSGNRKGFDTLRNLIAHAAMHRESADNIGTMSKPWHARACVPLPPSHT